MTTRIPSEVWRFCQVQIKEYPLREARLQEELKEAKVSYLYAGGNRELDITGVVSGNFASCPTLNKYEQEEAYVNRPDIRYLIRCDQRMKDAIRGLEPTEHDVLEAVWSEGWRDNENIARKVGISRISVARAKHAIVERLAIRWGLW